MTGKIAEEPSLRYMLQLFISGSTPRSTQAIQNLHRICEARLKNQYDLEVIDVYENPEMTKRLQILATPTLVKVSPAPLRRIIGDLSDERRVLAGLGLAIADLENSSEP